MDWIWIACGLIGAWACLRVMGAERERRMLTLKSEIASMAPQPPPPPAPTPEPVAPPNASKNGWTPKPAAAAAAAAPPVRAKAVR
jgi:hypothetical protein